MLGLLFLAQNDNVQVLRFVADAGVLFKYGESALLNLRLRLICWVGIVKGQFPADFACNCCSVVHTPVATVDVGATGLAVITPPG
jgi:hypothetical protein